MPDYQAKLSVNAAQEAAIGLLVRHTVGMYPLLFDPVARVNLMRTVGPRYIGVLASASTSSLKRLRDAGLFSIAEGGFDDRPTITGVELTPDFLVKLTFDLPVILTEDVEPANLLIIEKENGEAWDVLALVDNTIEHDGDTATLTKSFDILDTGVGESLGDGDVVRFTVGPDIAYFMHATKGFVAMPEDPFESSALMVVNTPTANVPAGTVLVGSTVTLSCSTPDSTIYYTDDTSNPTEDDTEYTGPIQINVSTRIRAFAVAEGLSQSDEYDATYSVDFAATPAATPVAGAVLDNSTIALASTTPGAAVYYTVNGDVPTAGSTLYAGPVTVTEAFTLKAIAIAAGYLNSAVLEAAYTIAQVATPVAAPVAGAVLDNSTVTLTCATGAATMYYTTNGDVPDAGDTEYTVPITITDAVTLKAIAVKTDMVDSAVLEAAYTIARVSRPLMTPLAGEVADNTPVTLTSATAGATIYYTTNGDEPDVMDTEYTVPIVITDPVTIKAFAIKTDMLDSIVTPAAYTIAP